MEENGLDGAVNLLEQLFDQKPGHDVVEKKKLKNKIRAGMTAGKNTNDNRSSNQNCHVPKENTSELTVYRNAVEKRKSSSSEDGLDLSDESNLLNALILDANATDVTTANKKENLHQVTRYRPPAVVAIKKGNKKHQMIMLPVW